MRQFINQKHKTVFSNKWISVKETENKFYYAERKGKNSISLLLYRYVDNELEVLIRYQELCAIEKEGDAKSRFAPCTITGGIDKDVELIDIAREEAYEEAGYQLEKENIKYIGAYVPSTQSNEICAMFIANVSGLKPSDTISDDGSYLESISYNEWTKIQDAIDLIDFGCVYSGLNISVNKLLEIEMI